MRAWAAGWLVAVALSATGASAYEQRSGTFSIGLQGQLSALLSAAECENCLPAGEEFEADRNVNVDYDIFRLRGLDGVGVGLSVRVRYAIDRASAIGLSFDASDFERSVSRTEAAPFEVASRDTADKIHATIVTGEYYRYFMRKAKQTPYVVVGAGFYRPEIRFGELNTGFPGSDLAITVGAGGEHFFTRSVSLDLSARVYGLFHDGGPSISSQVALGIRFYHIGGRRR